MLGKTSPQTPKPAAPTRQAPSRPSPGTSNAAEAAKAKERLDQMTASLRSWAVDQPDVPTADAFVKIILQDPPKAGTTCELPYVGTPPDLSSFGIRLIAVGPPPDEDDALPPPAEEPANLTQPPKMQDMVAMRSPVGGSVKVPDLNVPDLNIHIPVQKPGTSPGATTARHAAASRVASPAARRPQAHGLTARATAVKTQAPPIEERYLLGDAQKIIVGTGKHPTTIVASEPYIQKYLGDNTIGVGYTQKAGQKETLKLLSFDEKVFCTTVAKWLKLPPDTQPAGVMGALSGRANNPAKSAEVNIGSLLHLLDPSNYRPATTPAPRLTLKPA